MARQWGDGKSDGKSGGKAPAAAAAKGSGKGERGATPAVPAEAGAPPKSWAHRHAGTIYILGAFGLVVLIAVLRATCN